MIFLLLLQLLSSMSLQLELCSDVEEQKRDQREQHRQTHVTVKIPPHYIPCSFKQVLVLAYGEHAHKLICHKKYFMPEKVSKSQQLHKYDQCVR